jgi:hypothetical protein
MQPTTRFHIKMPLARFKLEMGEEFAQFQHRSNRTIRHQRARAVALAVNLPDTIDGPGSPFVPRGPIAPVRAFLGYHVAKSVGASGTLLDVLVNGLIGVLNDAPI